MNKFKSILLREKFDLFENDAQGNKDVRRKVTAMSNRMTADLENEKGQMKENLVVRAHNMHSCVRMVARLLQAYQAHGPIMTQEFDWEKAWDLIVNDFEYVFNPQRWIAVYYRGKVVFEQGERHPLLDVIEKCDSENKGVYEEAVPLAERALAEKGKSATIEYDGNVALVADLKTDSGRCGIILRAPNRTTTFNFTAKPSETKTLNKMQMLSIASGFLEGMNLAFLVGMNQEKLRLGLIERFSSEDKLIREGRRRLAFLSNDVRAFEKSNIVHYRPERPSFKQIVSEAEKHARTFLKPADEGDEEWVE